MADVVVTTNKVFYVDPNQFYIFAYPAAEQNADDTHAIAIGTPVEYYIPENENSHAFTCPFCADKYNGYVLSDTSAAIDTCPICSGKRQVIGIKTKRYIGIVKGIKCNYHNTQDGDETIFLNYYIQPCVWTEIKDEQTKVVTRIDVQEDLSQSIIELTAKRFTWRDNTPEKNTYKDEYGYSLRGKTNISYLSTPTNIEPEAAIEYIIPTACQYSVFGIYPTAGYRQNNNEPDLEMYSNDIDEKIVQYDIIKKENASTQTLTCPLCNNRYSGRLLGADEKFADCPMCVNGYIKKIKRQCKYGRVVGVDITYDYHLKHLDTEEATVSCCRQYLIEEYGVVKENNTLKLYELPEAQKKQEWIVYHKYNVEPGKDYIVDTDGSALDANTYSIKVLEEDVDYTIIDAPSASS